LDRLRAFAKPGFDFVVFVVKEIPVSKSGFGFVVFVVKRRFLYEWVLLSEGVPQPQENP
jgi:hypothetical protein